MGIAATVGAPTRALISLNTGLNIPGAPQCFHAVHRRASRPVLTGSGCHLDIAAGKLGRLPPVHFFDVGDALTPKPRAEAEAHIP